MNRERAGAHAASERVYLRNFNSSDFNAVHMYAADPQVVRYFSWGPNTPEETLSFINSAAISAERQPRQRYDLAIILRSDETLIGGCGLYIQADRCFEAEIGYCLQRQYWGAGFGTEVAALLVYFAFNKLKLHRVFATCDPKNAASIRVLEKVGLKREGLMRGYMKQNDKWADSLLYAILKSDVEAAGNAYNSARVGEQHCR